MNNHHHQDSLRIRAPRARAEGSLGCCPPSASSRCQRSCSRAGAQAAAGDGARDAICGSSHAAGGAVFQRLGKEVVAVDRQHRRVRADLEARRDHLLECILTVGKKTKIFVPGYCSHYALMFHDCRLFKKLSVASARPGGFSPRFSRAGIIIIGSVAQRACCSPAPFLCLHLQI